MSDDVDQNPDENGKIKNTKFGEIVSREASSQEIVCREASSQDAGINDILMLRCLHSRLS